jgi:prevent-host-death family protein
MKIANLADVKNDLSRFVAEVRRGGRVRILVRGVPAADLVPVEKPSTASARDDVELTELETLGLVRRNAASPSSKDTRELERPGPRVRGGRAVEALLAERKATR